MGSGHAILLTDNAAAQSLGLYEKNEKVTVLGNIQRSWRVFLRPVASPTLSYRPALHLVRDVLYVSVT